MFAGTVWPIFADCAHRCWHDLAVKVCFCFALRFKEQTKPIVNMIFDNLVSWGLLLSLVVLVTSVVVRRGS